MIQKSFDVKANLTLTEKKHLATLLQMTPEGR